jgi:probable blue pigment (indigoidine) exporter
MTNMKTTATALIAVLAPISWGTTYVTITELLPAGRPLLVAAMRVAPAAVVLLAAGLLVSWWRPRGADLWRTAALGACNFGVFFPLLVVAVYRLPGGVAAAAGGLQPLLVAGLTWAVAGTRPRRLDLVVGCVAVLGVALVVVRPGAGLDPVGVLAAVGANVSFALGVVLTKRFPAPPNRLAATEWQMLAGAVVLVPLAAAVEGAPPPVTAESLAGFAYLGLVATALAFVVWLDGVRRLPVPAPPLLGLAAPVTGAAVGWALLDEALSPLQLVGFVVTVGAIAHGATAGRTGRAAGGTAGATATVTAGGTAGPTTRAAAVRAAGPPCHPANLTNDRVTTPQFCTVRPHQVPPQRALGNS